jgi:hypothetical protein
MSIPTFQLAEDLIDRVTASVGTVNQTYTIGSGLTYSNTTGLGSAYPNVSLSSPSTVTSTLSPNATVSGGFTMGGAYTAPWFTQNAASTKINLDGPDADIVVNGSSLVDAINSIRDRLNCLQINPELEAEWKELRALGDQYRELEQEILDKQATWDRLKAMPAPVID